MQRFETAYPDHSCNLLSGAPDLNSRVKKTKGALNQQAQPSSRKQSRDAGKEARRVTLSRRLERTTSSPTFCLCFATRGAYRFARRRRRASDEWSWRHQAPAKSLLHKLRRSRPCSSCALRDLLFQSDRLVL